MPLVCPDGAVVAYAWKRQLAGQAGASAVDRTRLVHSISSWMLQITIPIWPLMVSDIQH